MVEPAQACIAEEPAECEDREVRSAVGEPRCDSLAVGITWLLLLSVVQRAVGLGRNVFICRSLDPIELGRWNIVFQFLMLAPPLLVLGIPGTFGRYVEAYRLRGQLQWFLRKTLVVAAVCAMLGLLVMIAGRRHVAVLLFQDAGQADTVVLAGLVAGVVVIHNLLNQLLSALRQPRAVSIVNTTNTFVFTTVAIALVLSTSWGALGVAASYGAGCATAAVVASLALRARWREAAPEATVRPEPLWGKLVPLAMWIWAADLCFNLFAIVDRYMIVHASGHDAHTALGLVGQFHSSHVLGLLLISLGDMVRTATLPYMAHDWEMGDRAAVSQRLNRGVQLVSALLTLGAAAILIVAPWLFQSVLLGKYAAGHELLPLMMVYCCWNALALQMNNYLWTGERGYWIPVVLVAGILTNIGLNWWWLPIYGLRGAVASTAVANLLVLASVAAWSWRHGWRGDAATVAAMVLPASLLVHPLFAVAIVSGWLVWAARIGQLGRPEDRERLRSGVGRLATRFRRTLVAEVER